MTKKEALLTASIKTGWPNAKFTYMDHEEISEVVSLAMDIYTKNKCKDQRELCEANAKHWKFGMYKFKKGGMINAHEPDFE